MIGIALFVFGILASVAALHVIWAFGKSWPTQDRKALARTVIGVQSEQMPPAGVTLVVAGLIFAVGCLPWVWLSVLPFPISRTLAEVFMWAAVAVFALRGAATYTFYAKIHEPIEPFARLNRRYFSPLCLALAAGFLVLALAA